MPSRTPPTSLHGSPRFATGPRTVITVPSRIDATTAPGDYVDITFDWMPGVPSTLRIPKATAIALGSDLLGLGASTRSAFVPTPPIGGIPVHAAHEAPQDDDFLSPRAPAVAPPATVARFPRPGARRRVFTTPNLFAWGLIAALLGAAIVLWATGAGHVGD